MRKVGLTFTDPSPQKPLEERTVAELMEYASTHAVDLQGAKKKEDILLAIKNSLPVEE